jgi:uncharacterized protein (DUF736 family)
MKFNNDRPSWGILKPVELKPERTSIGSIWEKTSKDSNKYMNLSLKLPKEKLLALINGDSSDTVSLRLIAFSNRYKEADGETSPDFKIYEELAKSNE